MASAALPPRIRDGAAVVYAFCREADDAIDDRGENIGLWKRRVAAVFANDPEPHSVDRALRSVVRAYRLPRAPFDALLEGFAWDLEGRIYESFEDLLAYCVRVGGSIGALMACLMDTRTPYALARATDLGVAMQLTNIARDVGTDARRGRVYLPLEWMRAEGIEPRRWLDCPHFSPPLGRVVRRVLQGAEPLYARAAHGIEDLPNSCRPAIGAAAQIYRAIGPSIAARGYDSVSDRAVTTGLEKLWYVGQAMPLAFRSRKHGDKRPTPLAQARFMLERME